MNLSMKSAILLFGLCGLTACAGLRDVVGEIAGQAVCKGPLGEQIVLDLREAAAGRSVYAGIGVETGVELGIMLCRAHGYTFEKAVPEHERIKPEPAMQPLPSEKPAPVPTS